MMQSNLRKTPSASLPFPTLSKVIGPKARLRQRSALRLYLLLWAIGAMLVIGTQSGSLHAFGFGLMAPGAGFIPAVLAAPSVATFAALGGSAAVFALSLVIWFATGNVILPCLTWIGLAGLAAVYAPVVAPSAVMGIPILVLLMFWGRRKLTERRLPSQRAQLNSALEGYAAPEQATTHEAQTALSDDDLACMRFVLDRALQPVEDFNGFDRLDQFQTAALRYQINFASYALSMAQARYLPAFQGYMHQAQQNLNLKQQDPKVWRYWKLENAWGNFDTNGDPFLRDNIMYSGFLAAQLLYQKKAVTSPQDEEEMTVTCTTPAGETYRYTIHEIIERLVAQYETAQFGLLPCEPNWIFPLCNAITATAIRAYDSLYGTDHWERLTLGFQAHLEAEFISPAGQLIPFRSSYTGLAPPMIGGAVMQSFPCLFFNAVLPDLAQRQWAAMQIKRRGRDWRSLIWPVDVGNYGFSRAAGYTATAAAAREVGDLGAADALGQALDQDLPSTIVNGVAHRPNASIWAHANELMSRVIAPNALHSLVTGPQPVVTPYLKTAIYPDVLVAQATATADSLTCVVVPGRGATQAVLAVAGLVPGAAYDVTISDQERCFADESGAFTLRFLLTRSTAVLISKTSEAC